MVMVILGKIKVEGINFEEVFQRALKDPHDRIKKFYELSKPLLEKYMSYCIRKSVFVNLFF